MSYRVLAAIAAATAIGVLAYALPVSAATVEPECQTMESAEADLAEAGIKFVRAEGALAETILAVVNEINPDPTDNDPAGSTYLVTYMEGTNQTLARVLIFTSGGCFTKQAWKMPRDMALKLVGVEA